MYLNTLLMKKMKKMKKMKEEMITIICDDI